jgi:hypothetical protein
MISPDFADMPQMAGRWIDQSTFGIVSRGILGRQVGCAEYLFINIKIAGALGLAVPQSLPLRVDEETE